VVMGSLATVPPGDRFLSPVPDGRGSYERGSRSTLVYQLELFFSAHTYYQFGYLDAIVSQEMSLMYFTTTMVCYSTFLWRLKSSTKLIFVPRHSVVFGNYTLFILQQQRLVTPY